MEYSTYMVRRGERRHRLGCFAEVGGCASLRPMRCRVNLNLLLLWTECLFERLEHPVTDRVFNLLRLQLALLFVVLMLQLCHLFSYALHLELLNWPKASN